MRTCLLPPGGCSGSPIPRIAYTPGEVAVWDTVLRQLQGMFPQYACKEVSERGSAVQQAGSDAGHCCGAGHWGNCCWQGLLLKCKLPRPPCAALPLPCTPQFLRSWPLFEFREGEVPQLEDLSQVLRQSTSFQIRPVAGLVSTRRPCRLLLRRCCSTGPADLYP